MKVISIANRKGGVGKTTTAINIATALSAVEKKVLVLDSTSVPTISIKRKTSLWDLP